MQVQGVIAAGVVSQHIVLLIAVEGIVVVGVGIVEVVGELRKEVAFVVISEVYPVL